MLGKSRNVGLSIVLTIVTFGIYGVYWFIQLTNEANELSEENKPSGGMAFLLTMVSCGIYSFVWSYNMGKKMQIAQIKNGVPDNDNSVLYLALNFFALTIVTYALIQSDINRIIEKSNATS